jgi:hypothetical protein
VTSPDLLDGAEASADGGAEAIGSFSLQPDKKTSAAITKTAFRISNAPQID